jgi:hypothetical protein
LKYWHFLPWISPWIQILPGGHYGEYQLSGSDIGIVVETIAKIPLPVSSGEKRKI